MRTNRPYVQIDPDVLERVRQIDLLSYLREFEPSNLVKVKGTSNVYCTAEHDSLKISKLGILQIDLFLGKCCNLIFIRTDIHHIALIVEVAKWVQLP